MACISVVMDPRLKPRVFDVTLNLRLTFSVTLRELNDKAIPARPRLLQPAAGSAQALNGQRSVNRRTRAFRGKVSAIGRRLQGLARFPAGTGAGRVGLANGVRAFPSQEVGKGRGGLG
jgi:hypothetical protein